MITLKRFGREDPADARWREEIWKTQEKKIEDNRVRKQRKKESNHHPEMQTRKLQNQVELTGNIMITEAKLSSPHFKAMRRGEDYQWKESMTLSIMGSQPY
jgi:hypothetical protein